MTNGETGHQLCAFSLWEAHAEIQQLRLQNAALQNEVQRLKEGGEKLRAVPQPEEKQDA